MGGKDKEGKVRTTAIVQLIKYNKKEINPFHLLSC